MDKTCLEVRIRCDLGSMTATGSDWLECEDAFGIFYYSLCTKMATLELPPEIRAAGVASLASPLCVPAPSTTALKQQAMVLMNIGDWVIAEDDLGVFYQDKATMMTYDKPPPELMVLLEKKERDDEKQQLRRQRRLERQQRHLELRKMWEQQYGKQCPDNAPRQEPDQSDFLELPERAIVKTRIANWAIAEDSLGEFYQDMVTGESFEDPPPELLSILRQRVGATPAQDHPNQNMPSWYDLAAQAQPEYRFGGDDFHLAAEVSAVDERASAVDEGASAVDEGASVSRSLHSSKACDW
eukprot:CAMPEP_0170602176 /NCGR_PEP_ID=MMETSP0224-20130122/18252_1 /TAXON_ID=285029 /ORGANISM="Togula jolla, Strain CCCM 725" /LENGTH=296 /DNA_ID=CAMNT_0010926999 /DNA_START=61 /DNA_END=949 /DNA_ORIENTATION=+